MINKSESIKEIATALAKARHPKEEADILHKHFYTPLKPGRQHSNTPIYERILSRVFYGMSNCWHYLGVRNKFGYGRITYKGKTQVTHRLLYEAFNGEIPDGLYALHKCDNPSCVNPEHIFLGTYSDNLRDAWSKGRNKGRTGKGKTNVSLQSN